MDKQYRNGEQDRRLEAVEKHIATTNTEMGIIKVDIGGIKKDISWMRWWIKLMITSQIGIILTLVGILIKLLAD